MSSPDSISMTHSNMPSQGRQHGHVDTTPSSLWAMLRPGIEDHAVFPLLATRMDVSKLQQDHAEMDAIIESIEQACAS